MASDSKMNSRLRRCTSHLKNGHGESEKIASLGHFTNALRGMKRAEKLTCLDCMHGLDQGKQVNRSLHSTDDPVHCIFQTIHMNNTVHGMLHGLKAS